MESMKKNIKAVELGLEQVKDVTGGTVVIESEIEQSIRENKAAGKTFEQWLNTFPNADLIRSHPGTLESLKMLWDFTC